MKRYPPIVLMLVLSLAPFLWYGVRDYQAMGGGDFISLIGPNQYACAVFYIFEPRSLAGTDLSYISAHFMPYFMFYWLFSLVKISPFLTTLFFLTSILFVSQISMYGYVTYVLKLKMRDTLPYRKVIALVAAILYGFSPYIVGLISPGHVLMLISYALFPLILKAYDQFINERRVNLQTWYSLFLLFFFSASSFANVGSVAGIFIVLMVYSLFSFIFIHIPLRRLLIRLPVAAIAAYVSNAWWMTPYLLTIKKTIAVNEAGGGIPGSFGDAAVKASIANILFGRAEYLMHVVPEFAKYVSVPSTIVFAILIVLLAVAVAAFRKQKYFLLLLAMFLIGIYITKTNQPPFFEPYKFLYERVQLFQVFRRPVSKFYWWPLFFYAVIAAIGAGVAARELKRIAKFIAGGACVVALYFVYLFAKTPLLTPFSIPSYYYDAAKHLRAENAQKIFMLPSTYGFQPGFNRTLNGYYGIDFLWFVWPYSLMYPDSSSYSPALPFKVAAVSLMAAIRDRRPFCQLAKQLDVSHIVVRQNLSENTKVEDTPDSLIELLEASPDVASKKVFGEVGRPGFTIFTVAQECRGFLIQLVGDENASMTYSMISPVEYRVHVAGFTKEAELQYLTNFSKWWALFPTGKWQQLHKLDSAHHMVYNYANAWDISPSGSGAVDYTLYYLPQMFAYVGWVVTGTSLIGGFYFTFFRRTHT